MKCWYCPSIDIEILQRCTADFATARCRGCGGLLIVPLSEQSAARDQNLEVHEETVTHSQPAVGV